MAASPVPPEALLLTVAETALMLNVSTRLVESLIATGDVQSIRLGKRARRVPRDAVADYIARLRDEQADGDVRQPASPRLLRRVGTR